MLRHQLPAYSPITGAAIWQALRHALGGRVDGGAHDLERFLAFRYEAEQVRLFSSGTGALQEAIRAAMSHVGHRVVVLPAFTCFDVAAAAVAVGARIRLYDLDPCSLGPDLDSLKRSLSGEPCAVVVSPLYGIPVDWDALTVLTSAAGALLVEDAAQGHGGLWCGRPLGSLGAVSVLSFGRGKGHTGGAGGAMMSRLGGPHPQTNGSEGNGLRGELQVAGVLAAQWVLARPELYGFPRALPWLHLGETVYRDAQPAAPMARAARASIMTLWSAAEREAQTRRANAGALSEALGVLAHVSPITPPSNGTAGFLRFPVGLGRGWSGFSDVRRARRLGVAPSYPSSIADLPVVRKRLEEGRVRYPGAGQLARTLFTLPTHSRVTRADRDELLRMLAKYGA